jgi:hypothetical protein
VAALGKLDLEPLAEAVVRRGQEMNFHDKPLSRHRVDRTAFESRGEVESRGGAGNLSAARCAMISEARNPVTAEIRPRAGRGAYALCAIEQIPAATTGFTF